MNNTKYFISNTYDTSSRFYTWLDFELINQGTENNISFSENSKTANYTNYIYLHLYNLLIINMLIWSNNVGSCAFCYLHLPTFSKV